MVGEKEWGGVVGLSPQKSYSSLNGAALHLLILHLDFPLSSHSEEGNGIQSSIFAWRIPWTEEHDKLQFMGSQRVGNN